MYSTKCYKCMLCTIKNNLLHTSFWGLLQLCDINMHARGDMPVICLTMLSAHPGSLKCVHEPISCESVAALKCMQHLILIKELTWSLATRGSLSDYIHMFIWLFLFHFPTHSKVGKWKEWTQDNKSVMVEKHKWPFLSCHDISLRNFSVNQYMESQQNVYNLILSLMWCHILAAGSEVRCCDSTRGRQPNHRVAKLKPDS